MKLSGTNINFNPSTVNYNPSTVSYESAIATASENENSGSLIS